MRAVQIVAVVLALTCAGARAAAPGLWKAYDHDFRHAKYIDLTHTIAPNIPVWHGFGPSTFSPTVNPATGKPYSYAKDGFEATHYDLSTDQLGTQLDPPAHWAPEYPSIDELPPTYTVRPLAVISIVPQAKTNPGYHLQVGDVLAWEKRNGRIPAGAVVFVRSGWSKEWPNPALATRTVFPGVSLAALKFLHLQRHILFHATNLSTPTPRPPWKAKRGSCITATRRPKASPISTRSRKRDVWCPSAIRSSRAAPAATRATLRSVGRTGNSVQPSAPPTLRCQRARAPCIGTCAPAAACAD
jgi:kynurenine formamidase